MKRILLAALAFLGIEAFAKEDGKNILTAEQKTTLKDAFGDDFLASLETAMKEDSNTQSTTEGVDDPNATATEEKASPLTNAKTLSVLTDRLVALNKEHATLLADNSALEADKKKSATQIENLTGLVSTLSAGDENSPPPTKTNKDGKDMKIDATNDKYLFGVEEPYMAIDKSRPYNMRAYAAIMDAHGVVIPVPKASSLDYTNLKTDLGDFFRTRYNDEIHSWVEELSSLESIFPLQSGYQDQAVLTNLFLEGDFSQADNTDSDFDKVTKGGFKFEPEIIKMFDVMFAHKFKSLKALEKTWIGNRNREGSDPIKWSFVNFLAKEILKVLKNEQNLRYINGKWVKPILDTPGPAMAAADGLRTFMRKKIANLQLKPFELGEWSNLNAVQYAKAGCALIPQFIRETGRVKMYVSSDFKTAYAENYRALFGANTADSTATKSVLDYENIEMKVVPNLSPSKLIIWTFEGNINLFEDKPREMLDLSVEQQDWSLKVWSNWKESIWAILVGKKMASATDFPENYSSQRIWCNNIDLGSSSFIPMETNDTTPSVAEHKSLISVANSEATAITNVDDANTGDEVILKCGAATNAITIAKSGNFSLISAAWNPSISDTITLKKRSDGKWIELSRTTASTGAAIIAADDVTPSLADASEFITSANTGATAITNFDDAVENKVYTIYGGSNTSSSTIANSGNFVLTAAMTLSVGSWIKLQKAANSKFYEIERNA